MSGFDLSIFDTKTKANEGIEIEIFKPDGDTSGLFIRVLGADSEKYTKLKEQHDRARVRMLSKGGRNAVDNLYDHTKDHDVDLVVACTIGWRHASGDDMPFDIGADVKKAREFYTTYPRVLDQVRSGIHDPANFTQARANS